MKILLFTHKSDIDGMGNVVLAKLAFEEVEYILCETFNLDKAIVDYHKNGKIYNFDKIFITDLYPTPSTLSKLNSDEALKDKLFIFDHHKTSLEQEENEYSFVTLKIEDETGLCSGTSLFYEYLINNGLLPKINPTIASFVELTRRYDTWEWKTKYNDELAHELTLLFDSVGCEGYIKLMYQKLLESTNELFSFNELERMLIANKKKQIVDKLANYAKKVRYEQIQGLKAGIVFIDYEYRNDLAEYFRQHNYDMDFTMLISLDKGTISYRNIKDNINVRLIAESFGGKGHDKAASSPLTNNQIKNIIKIIISKNKVK